MIASLLTMGALLAALGSPTAPTLGAYCGPAADTAAVEYVFLREHGRGVHPILRSSIMAIAVYSPMEAQVAYAGGGGEAFEYFGRSLGASTPQRRGWMSAGYSAPPSFGKDAIAFFNRMQDLRANGGKECANPKFVPMKGSG